MANREEKCDVTLPWYEHFWMTTIYRELKQRRWRRQRKGKKVLIGLDWQNNNFARASRFFAHFLAVVARLRHETS